MLIIVLYYITSRNHKKEVSMKKSESPVNLLKPIKNKDIIFVLLAGSFLLIRNKYNLPPLLQKNRRQLITAIKQIVKECITTDAFINMPMILQSLITLVEKNYKYILPSLIQSGLFFNAVSYQESDHKFNLALLWEEQSYNKEKTLNLFSNELTNK